MLSLTRELKSVRELDYVIKTESPVTFSEKNNDVTLFATKPFVPGSAVRGLMAELLMEGKNQEALHEDKDFYDCILSGKVRFLPAYPTKKTLVGQGMPLVLPHSLMKSKIKVDDQGRSMIRDLTAPNAPYEVGFKRLNGMAVLTDTGLYPVTVSTQSNLHIHRTEGDMRYEGHSKDGNIYNYEYIEPGQYFEGRILIDEDMFLQVKQYMEKLTANGTCRLGRSRQAEYGQCRFLALEEKSRKAIDYKESEPLYLYLQTPYIPFEEWQRSDDVAADMLSVLEEMIRAKGQNEVAFKKEEITTYTTQEEIGGFVSVWGARHERMIAMSAGSLIKLECEGLTKEVVTTLEEVLKAGLGARIAEGYGQCSLWQPLDTTKIALVDYKDEKAEKPKELHAGAVAMAKKVLQEKVVAALMKHAYTLATQTTIEDKHILSRMEALIENYKKEELIKLKIEALRDIAKSNLRNVKIKGDAGVVNLQKALTEGDQLYMPMLKEYRLGLPTQQAFEGLLQELGLTEKELYADAYYTFWYWFMKHAKKSGKSA